MSVAPRWIPNLDVSPLLERFLVAGASAFLLIRSYLALTNYPQIGGHGLHIAHMLWGGLGMLVAVVLLLSFLGSRVRVAAATIGGAGFGTFIDELGKFITSDNNYFFRPTVAIIYVIFIALFLSFQAIRERRAVTDAARLAQGLDAAVSAVVSGYAPREREQALAALTAASNEQLAAGLASAIVVVPGADSPTSWADRLFQSAVHAYQRAVQSRSFFGIAVVIMAGQALASFASVIHEITNDPAFSLASPNVSLGDGVKIMAGLVSGGCVIFGIGLLHGDRPDALHWFKRAILIAIFVVQLFSFYTVGLVAIAGLAVNLVLLTTINAAIAGESLRQRS